jgi:hypothetical protein
MEAVSEETRQAFEAWLARAWAWYQRKLAEGLTDDEILERLWGKETLNAWGKMNWNGGKPK